MVQHERGSLPMSLDDNELERLIRECKTYIYISAVFRARFSNRIFSFYVQILPPRDSRRWIFPGSKARPFARRAPSFGVDAHPLILPACILVLVLGDVRRAYRCTRSAWRARCMLPLFAYLHTRQCIRDARVHVMRDTGMSGRAERVKAFVFLSFLPSTRRATVTATIEMVAFRSDIWCRWNFDAPAVVRIRRHWYTARPLI